MEAARHGHHTLQQLLLFDTDQLRPHTVFNLAAIASARHCKFDLAVGVHVFLMQPSAELLADNETAFCSQQFRQFVDERGV